MTRDSRQLTSRHASSVGWYDDEYVDGPLRVGPVRVELLVSESGACICKEERKDTCP